MTVTASTEPLSLLLDAHQSANFVGVSLRTFRDLVKREDFPKARSLGPRSTRWHREELAAWVAVLPAAERRDEPEHLAKARKARKKRQPTAHAPFPGPAAPAAPKPWREVR